MALRPAFTPVLTFMFVPFLEENRRGPAAARLHSGFDFHVRFLFLHEYRCGLAEARLDSGFGFHVVFLS